MSCGVEVLLMAYCSCACEVLYARKLAEELGFCQLTPTKIYEDNEGAIVLVKKMHLHADIGTKAVGPHILNRHVPVWLGELSSK